MTSRWNEKRIGTWLGKGVDLRLDKCGYIWGPICNSFRTEQGRTCDQVDFRMLGAWEGIGERGKALNNGHSHRILLLSIAGIN